MRPSLEAGIKASATGKTNFVMTGKAEALFEVMEDGNFSKGESVGTIARASGRPQKAAPTNAKSKAVLGDDLFGVLVDEGEGGVLCWEMNA